MTGWRPSPAGLEAFSPDNPAMCGDQSAEGFALFGEGDTERQGAGFARVRAFREGVMDGAEACLDYQA